MRPLARFCSKGRAVSRPARLDSFPARDAVGFSGGGRAVKVLYIDELLLVNFAAAAGLLLAAAMLAGVRSGGMRLAGGY